MQRLLPWFLPVVTSTACPLVGSVVLGLGRRSLCLTLGLLHLPRADNVVEVVVAGDVSFPRLTRLEQRPAFHRPEPNLVRQLSHRVQSSVAWMHVYRFSPTVQKEESTNNRPKPLHCGNFNRARRKLSWGSHCPVAIVQTPLGTYVAGYTNEQCFCFYEVLTLFTLIFSKLISKCKSLMGVLVPVAKINTNNVKYVDTIKTAFTTRSGK